MDISITPYPFPKIAIFDPAVDKRTPLRHLKDKIEVEKVLKSDSKDILNDSNSFMFKAVNLYLLPD
jgi:hypothetical protein